MRRMTNLINNVVEVIQKQFVGKELRDLLIMNGSGHDK